MQIDIGQFRAAFFTEASEHLQSMEAALLQLDNLTHDPEVLNTIFRAAHSIKGGSTTFGIDEVGKFTHVLESLLERVRDGAIETTDELVELLLASVDVIDGLVANAKDGTPMPANLEQVLLDLRRSNGETCATSVNTVDNPPPAAESNALSHRFRVALKPSRDFFRFGQDPLLLLRELHELGTVHSIKVDESALPRLTELQPDDCYLAWTLEIETTECERTIHDVFMFLDGNSTYMVEDCALSELDDRPSQSKTAPVEATTSISEIETPASPEIVAAEQANEFRSGEDRRQSSSATSVGQNEIIRVDRARLDELINQIGELVIGTSMVEQELLSITGATGLQSMSSLGKIVRDLQEMSLSLRMVPIATAFQKMHRVIRDVAKKLGKQINLVTEGDDTELDKSIVDQISDPLVHMVRNSADHGIETPEERELAGKPIEGRVTLRAYQQGGNIFIDVADDGRGLNRRRILNKAIERGFVAKDANLSDAEICNLIFLPGFSTADALTDISGRGVGMDVVRRNVEALQGSVSIKSVEGEGSTITVRMPLTLAILDGLLVRLTNQVYVIPLLSVIESICVRQNDIQRIVNLGEVITLRGEILPLLRLHRLLNIRESEIENGQGLLVIVEDQGRRFALKVDELLGQQQVVIKNLETNYRKVPGIAGATILGNGNVALILDVFSVSNLSTNDSKVTVLAGLTTT